MNGFIEESLASALGRFAIAWILFNVRDQVVYEGTMELSSRYAPHKQLLKRQTAISETFKHCR